MQLHTLTRSGKSVDALAALCAIVFAAGCTDDGTVRLKFSVPENDDLSPVGGQLAEITLVTTVPGESPRAETRRVEDPDEPVDLGRIPIADGVTLAVELRSPTQRLVGYGRAPGPIDVVAGRDLEIPVGLRRPFVYASGAPAAIATFDATREGTFERWGSSIGVGASPEVVVPTTDGTRLLVVSGGVGGGQVTAVSTSNHAMTNDTAIALERPPSDAAVSRDDRFLVVAHPTTMSGDGGVSIVDLETQAVQLIPLGDVGRVVIGPGPDREGERLFALLDRAPGPGCDGAPSSVVTIPLDAPQTMGPVISFDYPMRDIAVSYATGALVVADGCNGRLETIDPDDDAQRSELARVFEAGAVAIQDEVAVAVGTVLPSQGRGLGLLLVSIRLDGTGEVRLDLPEVVEAVTADDFTQPGQTARQQLNADTLTPLDLAVAPGGDQVAVLVNAFFHAEEFYDIFFGVIIPEMTVDTYEYVLVDIANSSIVQRLRTWCDLWFDTGSDPFLDDWSCASQPDQATVPGSGAYQPRRVSFLYGAR